MINTMQREGIYHYCGIKRVKTSHITYSRPAAVAVHFKLVCFIIRSFGLTRRLKLLEFNEFNLTDIITFSSFAHQTSAMATTYQLGELLAFVSLLVSVTLSK